MAAVKPLVKNLDRVMQQAQAKSGKPVIFPGQIPIDKSIKQYYASASLTNVPLGVNYRINIDRKKKCNGAHYCNIGTLQVENKGQPQIFHDRNGKKITYPVKLALNYIGYFTPGHAMADYWPAMLQWRDNSTMYTITWNIDPKKERVAIINMANSIILQKNVKKMSKSDREKLARSLRLHMREHIFAARVL
jgi:hypothetical protein